MAPDQAKTGGPLRAIFDTIAELRVSEVPAGGQDVCRSLISSVHTWKPTSMLGPNALLIATSVASRPRAIRTRPMRGTLFLASKVCQWSSTYASNQAAKSIGPYGGGTPTSP